MQNYVESVREGRLKLRAEENPLVRKKKAQMVKVLESSWEEEADMPRVPENQ